MKLTEIQQSLSDEIVEWLEKSGAEFSAYDMGQAYDVNLPDFRAGTEVWAKRLSNFISKMNVKTGVIDFGTGRNTGLRIYNRLESLSTMPFKIGKIQDISFGDFDINQLTQLDLRYLQASNRAYFEVTDKTVNMRNLAAITNNIKRAHEISVRLEGIKSYKNVADCSSAIQSMIATANYQIINIRGPYQTSILPEINIHDGGKLIYMSNYRKLGSSRVTQTSIRFNNVLDLQEWLFDNGYENLA